MTKNRNLVLETIMFVLLNNGEIFAKPCNFGPMARNHGNIYEKLLYPVLVSYGIPSAKVNGTE